VTYFCEHSSESSDSIRGREFFDQLSDLSVSEGLSSVEFLCFISHQNSEKLLS
jgi:hypothetical protein